jgi:lipopolysaccharide transport system ATP-binding protein
MTVSNADIVIRAEGLGKRYRIEHQRERVRYRALRDHLASVAAEFVRALADRVHGRTVGEKRSVEEFWALKDVSFDIKRGEVIGIIGRNGAGKSTLLKVLSRITEPTTGRVEIRGRLGSLLEVGTGFHPELTGRENIYLNAAILGMTRAEVRKKFDEIVAFAEVERFLDTPVKRYSSGMYVRLAFAVAAHLDPEILVVDEVLAVGDSAFQKKCLGKMQDVARGGRTVLFVSHNLAAVESLCTEAVHLDRGSIVTRGEIQSVVRSYMRSFAEMASEVIGGRSDRSGNGVFRFAAAWLRDSNRTRVTHLTSGQCARFCFALENASGRSISDVRLSFGIDNAVGTRLLLLDTRLTGENVADLPPGRTELEIEMAELPLVGGRYSITLWASAGGDVVDWLKSALLFDVEDGNFYGNGRCPEPGSASIVARHRFHFHHSGISIVNGSPEPEAVSADRHEPESEMSA